ELTRPPPQTIGPDRCGKNHRSARRTAKRIAVILRLAVLIHRGRGRHSGDEAMLEVDGRHINLMFSPDWLENNPLTRADLKQEHAWLKSIGLKLEYS
ncbi:MAG: hypothetical protein AAF197_11190, partial [Pseudomonadota bacterium]